MFVYEIIVNSKYKIGELQISMLKKFFEDFFGEMVSIKENYYEK